MAPINHSNYRICMWVSFFFFRCEHLNLYGLMGRSGIWNGLTERCKFFLRFMRLLSTSKGKSGIECLGAVSSRFLSASVQTFYLKNSYKFSFENFCSDFVLKNFVKFSFNFFFSNFLPKICLKFSFKESFPNFL